jgi:hypothetical protein
MPALSRSYITGLSLGALRLSLSLSLSLSLPLALFVCMHAYVWCVRACVNARARLLGSQQNRTHARATRRQEVHTRRTRRSEEIDRWIGVRACVRECVYATGGWVRVSGLKLG